MIKEKNIRITITISKKTNEKLDFIIRNSNKKKSQIIEDLINQKTSISKLWKDIEYNDLTINDKIYYVKSIIDSPYLQNTTNYTIKDLVFKMMESIQKLYQLEGQKIYVNEYNRFVKYIRENQLC